MTNGALEEVVWQGSQRLEKGDLGEALTCFRRALALAPGDAQSSHLLGITLVRLGNLAEALPLFQAAVAAEPAHQEYSYAQGVAQRWLGQNHQAEETFRALLTIDPQDFIGLCNLGELLANRDEYMESIALLTSAVALRPRDAAAVNPLALAMIKVGKADSALGLVDRSFPESSLSASLWLTRARALAELGRLGEAEAAARAAIGMEPQMALAHYQIGLCRYDAGNYPQAISAFRTALVYEPGLELARAALGIALLESGEIQEGTRILGDGPRPSAYLNSMADSWGSLIEPSLRDSSRKIRRFAFKPSHLRHALEASPKDGLVVELGVYMGGSLTQIASHLGDSRTAHGFDAFRGLPEDWLSGVRKGAYDARGVLPDLPGNAALHVGWFEDTLPVFVGRHGGKLAFVNIDCDIYSSTRTFFDNFAEKIVPGTILVFDEYCCYSDWRQHEYKAFREFAVARNLDYEYLALSAVTRQATVRIK